jgi:hypothetical protein
MATTKTNLIKVEIRYVPAARIGEVFMQAQLGKAEAFLPSDDMELIDMPGFNATRRAASHPKNLETIYKHYQNIDGTSDERTTQLRARSMTVGDAIVVNGRAFYVAAKGFVYKDAKGALVDLTEDNCEPDAKKK